MQPFATRNTYRFAACVALVATLLLIWLSLGVGIIGADGGPANRMYFGVVAVGIVGAKHLADFEELEAIDELVRRIKSEWPGGVVPLVVATGGLATTFQPFCKEFDRIEPYLTLDGLRIAHGLVSGAT